MRMYKHYEEDGKPFKCPDCRNKDFTDHIVSIDSGFVSETYVTCSRCHETVAYWAYGHYDPCYYNVHGFYNILHYILLREVNNE